MSESSDPDPLRQLEAWGRKVDRKVRRQRRGRRLRRALTAPGHVLRRRVAPDPEPPNVRRVRLGRRGVVATVALIAVVGVCWFGVGLLPEGPRGGGPAAGGFGTNSADPAGPFAHTPAAYWAEGDAGIVVPDAVSVPGFTRSEVAANLLMVKQALVAARLDRAMLVRHDPSALLALLAPAVRNHVREAIRAGRLASLVTLIDDGARLDGRQARVSGRMSFSGYSVSRAKTLEVTTNYVWAYAFEPGIVVVVHDEVFWRFFRSGEVSADDVGLRYDGLTSYASNMDCDAFDRGLLAPFRPTGAEPASTVIDPEDPDSLYAPDHTLNIEGTCDPPTTPGPSVPAA